MATPTITQDREAYSVTRDPRTCVKPEVWDREIAPLARQADRI